MELKIQNWNDASAFVLPKVTPNNIFGFPSKKFLDVCVEFRVMAGRDEETGEIAFAVVTEELMKVWDVDIDTLYETALANAERLEPAKLCPLEEKIFGLLGGNDVPEFSLTEGQIGVLTNKSGMNGFTTVLYPGLLRRIAEMVGDYFVLPSSVHEALIVPVELGLDPNNLKAMVCDINASDVINEDTFLSDNIYYYDKEKQSLICSVENVARNG